MGDRLIEEKTGHVEDKGLEIRRGDEGYPARLAKLPDPPKSLFVRGLIPSGPMVAIVGSRNADSSVCRFVSRLAGELTKHGLTIVSGGALGIDTAAHEGALDAEGVTVAVIGSGFDFMYPEANRSLFERIEGKGALVTEYSHEQPPTKWTFPRRNRIVAAMASAVIVAQAGERSGALITARIARELGVPLGAMPGAAGDPRNLGSHRLLREGAKMVENPTDVLALVARDREVEQLTLPTFERKAISRAELQSLSSTEVKILDILGSRPVHIDEIIVDTGLGSGETSAAILSLEMAGLVEDRGGKNFVRVE
ncbi:MAG: DNA-protecting protein DprA [Deltaproteobacteria bacterium]|nr:DNA-protecting protein DprA [Deltaproteobacteria bacterium]